MQNNYETKQNFVMNYISEHFIESVQKYEQLISNVMHQAVPSRNLQVFVGKEDGVFPKSLKVLFPGHNKSAKIQVTVVKILGNEDNIFILAFHGREQECEFEHNRFIGVLVETTGYHDMQIICNQVSMSTDLVLLEPFLEMDVIQDFNVLRVRSKNLRFKPCKQVWDDKACEVKEAGNVAFNNKKYMKAYVLYEYALSCQKQVRERKFRSILYSNSSACLYKMGLYDSCIKYSTIAINVDNSYDKAYTRKINGLLEKKLYSEVPVLLACLQQRPNSSFINDINKKYAIYLSNSLGMYNWQNIFAPGQEIVLADYSSKKFGLKKQAQTYVFYALEGIKAKEILLISKPILYINRPKSMSEWEQLSIRIQKCTLLQKWFGIQIRNLPCPCHPQGGTSFKKIGLQEIKEKLRISSLPPKNLLKEREQERERKLGIWPQFFRFYHSCEPNCSNVHFRNIMCVSATRNIDKDQILTLDYVSGTHLIDRKQFLLHNFGIFCKCKICNITDELEGYQDILNSFKSEVENTRSSYVNKQAMWEILSKRNIDGLWEQPNEMFIEKYIEMINQSVTWDDVLHLMWMLRNNKHQYKSLFIFSSLQKALSELLKVPKSESAKLINLIE